LATWPVGPTAPLPPGGMAILPFVIAGDTLVTLLSGVTAKRVAVLVPWFEVQIGLGSVGYTPRVQQLGSVMLASPAISETRSV
jgi:hypothetical protein